MSLKDQNSQIPARFVRRYKRFFADFLLEDGSEVTAHCPNPGRMTSCMEEGWEAILSKSTDPKRKLSYTWEMVHNQKTWIGIHTGKANSIVFEALLNKEIAGIEEYTEIQREYKIQDSRLDFRLTNADGSKVCFLEVKSVSYMENGIYYFPDAVTARGKKHLELLSDLIQSDCRSIIFFLVQRSDGNEFRAARHVDAAYAEALDRAYEAGVEIMAWECSVLPEKIRLQKPLPVPEYQK